MSDENVDICTDNAYETLRNEMQAQYNSLKESFEHSNLEKDELIAQLKSQNEDLQRALVRSAFTVPQPSEQPKTEEQLYQDKINAILDKAKQFSRYR